MTDPHSTEVTTCHTFMGAGVRALAIIDSRCLTTVAPMVPPPATVKCGVTIKAPPRRRNGRGHGTEGVRSSMHEQSIPTRHDARPRKAAA